MGVLIRIEDLKKVYWMGKINVPALNGIDLAIKRGEFVAVMGPSGSGKSTLMHIMGCLDTPSSGSYLLNNEEVGRLKKNKLSAIRNQEIGFVFQTFNLLPHLNIRKNVELPLMYAGYSKNERAKRVDKVIAEVGLSDRVKHKPSELSGGQRQRVAIARALVNEPTVILADEPTGNLDSISGSDILSIFSDLHRKGHTIIMVTHDKQVSKKANRTIEIIDGKICNGDIS